MQSMMVYTVCTDCLNTDSLQKDVESFYTRQSTVSLLTVNHIGVQQGKNATGLTNISSFLAKFFQE